jgi:hypothetical protein
MPRFTKGQAKPNDARGPKKGAPNAGRPPSALREAMRGSLDQRLKVAEQIADGWPVKRVDVPLLVVLRYAHCPKCGDALKANAGTDAADMVLIQFEAMESASPADRIRAIELLAKYGLGTTITPTDTQGEDLPAVQEWRVGKNVIKLA